MLLRLAYLGITSTFALLRLLPGSDRDKDAEILTLRHQLAVLQRQFDGQRVRFDPADRAWLAALLHRLPKPSLHRLRLLVRPDTVLRWHRGLVARRHAKASRPRRRGRPPTIRSIRTLVWNPRQLLHARREFEIFYNAHRPHQGIANARPLAPLPEPITDSDRIAHLNIHRRDRLDGVLREYEHAA